MTLIAGVTLGALSLLLALAGAAKLRRPDPAGRALGDLGVRRPLTLVRVAALTELTVAVVALGTPAAIGGSAAAVAFVGLAIVADIGRRRIPTTACGCFGETDGAPFSARQVVINLLCAVGAIVVVVCAPPSFAQVAVREPARAALMLASALVLAGLLEALLRGRGGPVLRAPSARLVDVSARAVETHFSRRSALTRIALTGSALCVAPLRYLLYPVSALAVIVPSDCRDGLCTDGYTAFCCEINDGLNTCPAGTFPGGWWMCTDYRGHQLCESTGVRYYIDCNALPGSPLPGECRCAKDDCSHRRVACNIFRYGQCNTQIAGTTAVVCRMVSCVNPGSIPSLNCSSATMVDDAVCGHEAPCLEPPAIQLQGAGGA